MNEDRTPKKVEHESKTKIFKKNEIKIAPTGSERCHTEGRKNMGRN
jgi:hypothetical protein